MNYADRSLADICSAKQLAEIEESKRAFERAVQVEKERKRKVGEATIELNERATQQNEILKAQLVEVQKVNELLVKQAADSARDAKRSLIVAVASLIVAILALVMK